MNRITVILCLTWIFSVRAGAQQSAEYVFPLEYNPVIKEHLSRGTDFFSSRLSSTAVDTLSLPFFDDFSESTVWPDQMLWEDSLAFINYNFPVNPPTVGIVTFDGLDQEGNPYDNTTTSANGLCDVLTSKALDLEKDANGLPYNSSDSIFLIFYYQRGGLGDVPETFDSLTLQFYSPVTSSWESVWSEIGGNADTSFTRVRMSINDPDYRKRGFKFRFRNYGSQTGNLDIWNVDYVSLRKFLPPDYEDIRDFAYVYQGESLLRSHTAIPWKHYAQLSQSQQQAMMVDSSALTVRNNNESNPFPIKIAGNIFDQYGNKTQIVGGGGLNSIQVPLNTNKSAPAPILNNYYFQDPTPGYRAVFTAVYEIGQTSGGIVDDYPQNDTLRYTQDLYNYYSYDDGTAELAYGVVGIGSMIAYKFELLASDTLRAVDIFFTQLGSSVTNKIFRIAVWSGTNKPSGSPIYEKFNLTPNYSDSINGFYTYLTDDIYLTAGTYFFGMIQNQSTILNLGLDVNTSVGSGIKFFNTTGNWTESQIEGAWMLRPVFSDTPIDVSTGPELLLGSIGVYPVPANNVLHFSIPQGLSGILEYEIIDMAGRIIHSRTRLNGRIPINDIDNGMYLIRFFADGYVSENSVQRIIISR